MRLKTKKDYIYSEDARTNLWTSKIKVRDTLLDCRSGRRTNVPEDHASLSEMYMVYPYKKYRKPNTPASNEFYVKKANSSKHKYAVDYLEYKQIILCFIKHLYEYLLYGHTYRFTSDIGEIRISKYKPKFLGWNLPKAIKRLAKDKNIPYAEAKMLIPENKHYLEERKNILLNGYRFRLMWFNRYTNVRNITFWYLKFTDSHNSAGVFIRTLKFYERNLKVFQQLLTHSKNKSEE